MVPFFECHPLCSAEIFEGNWPFKSQGTSNIGSTICCSSHLELRWHKLYLFSFVRSGAFSDTLLPSEILLMRTWGWKRQVGMKNNNVFGEDLRWGRESAILLNHHQPLCSLFLPICLRKRKFSIVRMEIPLRPLLSKLMWHAFPHFPEIVTWGLFLHSSYEAKCKKLSQRWFFHRTLMYTEKEIVEKGLGEGKNLHSHNWPLAN